MTALKPIWSLALPNEDATLALARDIAPVLRAGDLVTLSGDLGAGKTAFSRALIRAITGDAALEVPSPTFTLMQVYDTPAFPIVHADLYRIADPEELGELGWDEAAEGALVLVEWPERAGGTLPADRLDVALTLTPEGTRHAAITAHGGFVKRVERVAAIGRFLRAIGWNDARRQHIQGDASTRSYERLTRVHDGAEETAVLMNAPARTDTAPVRYGRPYSAIAHIAQDMRPFVAMARGLGERGFSTPRILAANIQDGVALLEDLGREGVVDDNGPMPERYGATIDVLAALHAMALPRTLPVAQGIDHRLPDFDLAAMEIEVELLIEWYLPRLGARQLAQRDRDSFVAAWRSLFAHILHGPRTWLLRDVHSPNLIWLAEREELQRIGLLDFQDAMIGSPAYDVAALCLDARVTVPEPLELQLISRYVKARLAADQAASQGGDLAFDPVHFARDYAIMGAQRTTKILGLFARLDKRDGKPAYLQHIPRVRAYLDRTLAHPALAELKAWFDEFVVSAEGQSPAL